MPSTTQFVKGDIQSADLINFVLNEDNIDTIMHFAAQVLTLTSCYRARCLIAIIPIIDV